MYVRGYADGGVLGSWAAVLQKWRVKGGFRPKAKWMRYLFPRVDPQTDRKEFFPIDVNVDESPRKVLCEFGVHVMGLSGILEGG